ncbi:sensor histidine kinase [Streptomyces lydicus]|uniref:sensor histidine kinase n=1 Tax=Streptomyces lydicus TaxID=47763 RepID=UPI0037D8319D
MSQELPDRERSQGAEGPGAPAGTGAAGRPPEDLRTGSPWTTRRTLNVSVLVTMVLLTLLGGCGIWVFVRSAEATGRLVDRSSPALVAAVKLESALVNQETGIRGYGLTGRREFLEPYHDGLAQERAAAARLRSLLGHDGQAAQDLARVLERTEAWQKQVARPVAAAPSGAPVRLATQRAQAGLHSFDAVRTELAVQRGHLQEERDRARAELQRVRVLQNWVSAAIAFLVLALLGLAVAGLRRAVTTPLGALSSDVRAVTRGDFRRPVHATGPADLRALASDIDGMRQRLVEELEFSDAARSQLDEQATELQRSNNELEQFAYVASHDLQEPLRKVASFCQLLQRRNAEQLDDRAQQYIAFAVDGANRMQALINDLLAFSRVGRVHADHTSVDLQQLFGQVRESLSIAIEEASATITHDPLPTVPGDPTQLGMLLQNLLSNAVKFRSPDRPPAIHLSVRKEEDGYWRFAMEDNGIGIDPAYSEKVFVIFQRLHTRESYAGTGIGLALCKKVVEYHGGAIAVDHDHSPGTRITFTLADHTPEAVASETAERAPQRETTAS